MLATQHDSAIGRSLIERLTNARQHTDDLFALVKPDSLYARPIAERHRIVFYIGHLEAFDWNLFHQRVFELKAFHPEFDRLFAFGIDPVGGGLPSDQPSDWPSIAAVRDYVSKIRAILDDKLTQALLDSDLSARDGFPLSTLLNVAIEHRLMHAETLAYMLHQLPLDRKKPHAEVLSLITPTVVHRSIEIPAGVVNLGLPRGSDLFGWDNEYEAHTVDVPAFAIDEYKVTNRQYLEFITAGGYETRTFWGDGDSEDSNDDDWNWKSSQGISHPAFWKHEGDQWLFRTMFEDVPLPLDWPVYVSQAEAKAYARWTGKSLPTEAEWQRAAYATAQATERSDSWRSEARGAAEPAEQLGNFDFARWSPVPVNALSQTQSPFGVRGMLGNGWEWTSTQFAPFPGFDPFPFYRGYSADFFDGKHFVMKGGSARTAACMLRPSFRNWFQAHYQFIYTGFRCVSR
ncbi:MAG TPA: SUMF1/EgtB/PvdO family nonheme iron enzyme [Candidatus Sulfotelmatobacter sp.]|jgi:iron(II)-dependent oxidoreductase|nr:SUMF1/EgtB/PvdO family nonheme iron enzyme [Candidatus Sulfotelmatobacter sp.]